MYPSKEQILGVTQHSFNAVALEMFQFQAESNKIYKTYLERLNVEPRLIKTIVEIPFMPISFFKHHIIKSLDFQESVIYTSSGTGTKGAENPIYSKHFVKDKAFYLENATQIFETAYGCLENYTILALLPSYLERSGSSLIDMVEHFINKTKNSQSGFFLNDFDALKEILIQLTQANQKTILWGVTFGLLDFIETFPEISQEINPENLIVFETGGMKGRRTEMTRNHLHNTLKTAFGVDDIHSEYGMTELLSQAYSKGNGVFDMPNTMKVLFRETTDPFNVSLSTSRSSGGINIIDLANYASCSFIETMDIGKSISESQFEVLGRFDTADIRGCNLMLA